MAIVEYSWWGHWQANYWLYGAWCIVGFRSGLVWFVLFVEGPLSCILRVDGIDVIIYSYVP